MKTSNKLMAMLLVAALAFSVVAIGADNSTISDADVSSDTTELQALIDAGGTVKLEKNYTVAQITVKSGTTVILDLNGFIIETTEKTTGRNYYIDNYGTLTITDSNSTKENSRTLESGYGFMKSDGSGIEEGAVTILGGYIWARGVENLESGNLTINDGTIISCNTNGGAAIWNEAILTVNGGTFRSIWEGNTSGAGCLNNYGDSASAIIYKGNFLGANARVYAIISSGTISITPQNDSDVLVRGQHGGLAIDGGTGTVRGGTYSSTNYYGLYVSNDGIGESSMTAAVSVYGGSYTGKTISAYIGSDISTAVYSVIDIYGGNFTKLLKVQDNVGSYGIKVFGGTYANDPGDYLATGYEAVEDSGTWTVSPKTTTVTVDMNCDDLTNDPTFTIKYDASTMTEWNAGSSGVADYSGMQSARSGYTFGGLYEDSACTASKIVMNVDGTLNSQSSYVTEGKWKVDAETKTLYAKWIATYTVSFETNGGTEIKSQTILEGAKASKPSDPTRDGYVFKGWFTDQEFTSSYDFSTQVTSSFTLYAKWEETPATLYTVTFMNGSSVYYAAKVKDGNMVSKPIDPTTTEQKRFAGWYTENGGTTKFDFTTKIAEDTTLYAGWTEICYVSVPESVAGVFTTTKAGNNAVNVSAGTFNFDVTAAEGYTLLVYAGDDVEPLTPSGSTFTVTDLSKNVTIYIETLKGSEWTQASESYIENDDGTVTETKTNTVSNTDTKVSEISESATIKDSSGAEISTSTSTATVTETAATLNVTTTSSEEATITESFVIAVTEALEEGTTISVDVVVETPKVNVPKTLLTDEKINDVTVVVNNGSSNSATITIPKTAIVSGDMADTVSVSVTEGTASPSSSALGRSSATDSFDMNLEGTNTTVFITPVSVAYDVTLPEGASNVRAYCIDDGRFYDATYSNGTVYFDAPHFSSWVIVYDNPEDEKIIVEDDDDILFILEQQRKAREAAEAASQTTTGDDSGEEVAVIIAAAAVAGAMLACAFFAFRRN